jgi:hypothetical protein
MYIYIYVNTFETVWNHITENGTLYDTPFGALDCKANLRIKVKVSNIHMYLYIIWFWLYIYIYVYTHVHGQVQCMCKP